jgi:hypothetical protein
MIEFHLIPASPMFPFCVLAWIVCWVHSVKTHGWLFAFIWLGVGSAATTAVVAYLSHLGRMSIILGSEFDSADGTRHAFLGIDPLLYLAAGLYLSAVLAKGLAERSRFRGEIVPFAALAATIYVFYYIPMADMNESVRVIAFDLQRDFLSIETDSTYLPLSRGSSWSWGFIAAMMTLVFAFSLAYRLVSKRTERNGPKLVAMTLIAPLLIAIATLVGWWTI